MCIDAWESLETLYQRPKLQLVTLVMAEQTAAQNGTGATPGAGSGAGAGSRPGSGGFPGITIQGGRDLNGSNGSLLASSGAFVAF